MIFEPELETMPVERLRELQGSRLRELIAYVRARVPFYRERLGGLTVDALADLPKLPLTRKTDLRDHYPFGLFAVPLRDVVRVHASSGTTGKPTVVGYTAGDVDVFARVNARALAMAGGGPEMILHNAYGYGLFTGGLGLHYGGERLGMAGVPVSGGMTERQLLLIEDFRPDLLCCTPSYALTLAQELAARGVSPDEISLRYACLGAEPWTEAMRAEVDAGLGIRSTNIYGLSEITGPGISNECVEERSGSHVNEDHFYPEIVDPDSGDPLAEGEEGVLVFTTLTKQALPLIRYWTGDICSLSSEPCSCGRTLRRMSLIRGRVDDMLIIRGVNIYPSQIEAVIPRVPGLTTNYRLVVTREGTLDELTVEVEGSGNGDELARLVKETTGCSVAVQIVPPGSVPRSEGGKLQRVHDLRRL
ncbi:MAG: phenylacetate--CoA ligase [Actinobacteria bacterium]|nr:phenylacetate--CoA ligase [Actinomycetota bacterium]